MDSEDIKDVLQWLEIRERYGKGLPSSVAQLRADIDHSSLLHRLLEGKPVFPEPPPRSFSYPWYHLIETGSDEAGEVYLITEDNQLFPKGTLIVDQFPWAVQMALEPDAWIASYRFPNPAAIEEAKRTNTKLDTLPMTLSASRWKVYSPGPHPKLPDRKRWLVERATGYEAAGAL